MNAQEWNKLRKNWDQLLDMYPSKPWIYLYTNDVITANDMKKIEKAEIGCDRMEKLLSILKSKPAQAKAYKNLLEAIEDDPCKKSLAEQIRATETTSDAKLTAEVDPHLCDGEVRKILHERFVNEQGTTTKLSDIRDVLNSAGVFNGKNEWSNEILQDFVWKEFTGVEILRQKKKVGRANKKVVYMKNIRKIDPPVLAKKTQDVERSTPPSEPTVPKAHSDTHEVADLKKMNPSQLKQYLLPKLEEEGLPTAALDELERDSVSGKVFLTMQEEDFEKVVPSANFGVRRFFTMLIKKNILPNVNRTYPEYPRPFDSDVKHTDKYTKGHCMDASINVRGKKTTPVRNFHVVDAEDKNDILDFIGSEVVPFASACLNDRRNGTIYFGVNPSDCEQFKAGEIVGIDLPKGEVQEVLNDFLQKSFLPSQRNIISNTVRDARFVPVLSDSTDCQDAEQWVIEVDVVPASVVVENDTIRTNLSCLPIFAKHHKRNEAAVFKFSENGMPKIVSSKEIVQFEQDQKRCVKQRQEEEAQSRAEPTLNLRTRLLNLLTGGLEVMEDTVYTFLMTSPIDKYMDEEYLSRNMTFIKQLNAEVVFDFDPKGSTDGIYRNLDSVQDEVMRVLTTDNFDKSQSSKDDYKEFKDSLANENRTSWVFCNGYEAMSLEPMDPTKWNRNRRKAFQESLTSFVDNFGEDRIIVIICLFSKNYKVMIEACDEMLTKLPENWMLMAENEDIAKLWQEQILNRNRVEKTDLMDRCVIGMPWEQVNTTILQAVKVNEVHECCLPSSTGALIEVREKKLKDWCDVEVLSAGEFDLTIEEKDRKRKEVEEQFYRGEQAKWLNFWFHDQVLKRDIHTKFMSTVKEALDGKWKEEEDKVTCVPILHQPGAGGTTSAMHVLWELRQDYRCCIVRTITNQTCDQLDEIRRYNDTSPKPLLILIDNEDEDKYLQLRGSLEERGRKYWRHTDETFNVYCTIILCLRRASLPRQLKHFQIALRQELTKTELDWFREKHENLESRFRKDKDANINPKFLITFNILKENFNKEYISKVVKEFSDDIKSPAEVKLLKIISLLNTYDPHFKPIRVSCLDKVLEESQYFRNVLQRGRLMRNVKWEANLSQGVRVLLNLSSNKNEPGKARRSLRMFSKIIAQEILSRMKERTEQQESEIMFELLQSGVFEQESSDSKHLQSVINSVIKTREYKEDGFRKHKFSRFVIHVQTTEGAEVAASVLEHLFELNRDPFTAQLISRFYIEVKNWDRAEYFANRATSMLPTNSFLWDTYGQVFKNKLCDKISPTEGFKQDEIHEVIELSEKCIDAFRKEQKISELEVTTNGENNFAGYFGELRAIVVLLSALKMCSFFSRESALHRYLVNKSFIPQELSFLSEHEAEYLKNLEIHVKEAMRRLDEEYLQMKGSVNPADMVSQSFDFDRQSLVSLKVNLDVYFGEGTDVIPPNLSENDKCEYRRRRARHLGATSLALLLNLRQNNGTETLRKIYSLMMLNVKSKGCTFDDLKTILDVVTVLLIDNHVPPDLNFDKILEWCRRLYTMDKPQMAKRSYLEKFLYFVLYNFPTPNRQQYKLCYSTDLSTAMESWYEAFKKNYPKHGREQISLKRRETTLFFLGTGQPLHDIVHQDALSDMEQYSLYQKWELPQLRDQLMLMKGTLRDHGERIELPITTKEGNRYTLSVPTSHKVTKRDMWQKTVYFYIGFSFSGPRAFGMSLEELGRANAVQHRIRNQVFVPSSRKQQHHPILETLIVSRTETENEMKMANSRRKAELGKKLDQINRDIRKLIGE